MNTDRHIPVVFVSSTCYDLKQVREDLKDFFEINYGFQAMLSEFSSFPIDPCIGTFENCLSNVDKLADIFILIVGTRYGYVTERGKSITNLEYLHAKAKGIPVFVFVDKQLHSQLKIWEANKEGNFSTIVDNPQIFKFVSEIYNESKQWIYTYESVRDITTTMKHQLSLICRVCQEPALRSGNPTSIPRYFCVMPRMMRKKCILSPIAMMFHSLFISFRLHNGSARSVNSSRLGRQSLAFHISS